MPGTLPAEVRQLAPSPPPELSSAPRQIRDHAGKRLVEFFKEISEKLAYPGLRVLTRGVGSCLGTTFLRINRG